MNASTSPDNAGTPSALTQAEQVTAARLADRLSAAIARKAGTGESVYTAVYRALEERPKIVRAVACHTELLNACQAALDGSVDMLTYPDGACLDRDIRNQLRNALFNAKGETT